mmetsp:Transcript_102175/g.327681  ORF Transcript_102175/g.327681 Transcript_102175/m.327681 type:complete len:203 (-) Transcript_102175:3209-3817(-)
MAALGRSASTFPMPRRCSLSVTSTVGTARRRRCGAPRTSGTSGSGSPGRRWPASGRGRGTSCTSIRRMEPRGTSCPLGPRCWHRRRAAANRRSTPWCGRCRCRERALPAKWALAPRPASSSTSATRGWWRAQVGGQASKRPRGWSCLGLRATDTRRCCCWACRSASAPPPVSRSPTASSRSRPRWARPRTFGPSSRGPTRSG